MKQNLWLDKWILHHRNMPSLTALSVKHILAKKQIPVLELHHTHLLLS
jgi:hypothetical protein